MEKQMTFDEYIAMRAALNISPLRLPPAASKLSQLKPSHDNPTSTFSVMYTVDKTFDDDHMWENGDYEYLMEPYMRQEAIDKEGKEGSCDAVIENMILLAMPSPAKYAYTAPSPTGASTTQFQKPTARCAARRPRAQKATVTPLTQSSPIPIATKIEADTSAQSVIEKFPLLSSSDVELASLRLLNMKYDMQPGIFSQWLMGRPGEEPHLASMPESMYDSSLNGKGRVSMEKLDQVYAGVTQWEIPCVDIRPLFRGPFLISNDGAPYA